VTRAPPLRYAPFQIKVGDRTYKATRHVEGDHAVMSSAYGAAAKRVHG
jgi:hypothetical protein